ncbi:MULTISPECIES: S-layer homology domain-containing protein [Paenibacillus]|uniref:S-layer homology domain-containing protein n=1 Tax=Paenibacillus TaxID=44249 RepID=UPI0022B91CD1|nr:S-layer homology domain-containing protein [Paenibacillus caseinilyticus]MCZ8523224.1 S-layer homology domain-containing protein [Paenibacillus caseinilyticus]
MRRIASVTLATLLMLTLSPLLASGAENAKPKEKAAAPASVSVLTDTYGGVRMDVQPGEVKKETPKDGRPENKIILDRAKLKEAFGRLKDQGAQQPAVTAVIPASESTVKIHIADAVLEEARQAAPGAFLVLQLPEVSYKLPVGISAKAAEELKVPAANVTVVVTIKAMPESALGTARNRLSEAGATEVLPAPVDFKVTAQRTNGQTVDLTRSGSAYVERVLTLPASVDSSTVTAVTYANGEISFVPAVFSYNKATVLSPAGGWFTVVSSKKEFTDTAGHWAEADIRLLASKLLVKGTSATEFSPDKPVTRAEFAVMLSRALGLSDNRGAAAKYSDIGKYTWFAGPVGAASAAGLVEGYDDGTFKPNARISREQMAVMLTKALSYGSKLRGLEESPGSAEPAPAVYEDSAKISSWAAAPVNEALKAGLMQGLTESKFAPKENATRAQAVALLKRLLISLQLINSN